MKNKTKRAGLPCGNMREFDKIMFEGDKPMSLAKRLLNNPGLIALCVPDEIKEVKAVFKGERVTLKRTFNMTFDNTTLKFWRVTGPANHPNLNSDLSVIGLKEWGII